MNGVGEIVGEKGMGGGCMKFEGWEVKFEIEERGKGVRV